MKEIQKRFDIAIKGLEKLTDEELSSLTFTLPWQYDADTGGYSDPDNFSSEAYSKEDKVSESRSKLQKACWDKFHTNPHMNTAVRGISGRLTGFGFEVTSDVFEIREAIREMENDPRNRLYNFWPKYVVRSFIEGELFLVLTVHPDGFIEVDFMDPDVVQSGMGTDGIIYHPSKTTMPLVYCIENGNSEVLQIPSIFLAYYPELIAEARRDKSYNDKYMDPCRTRNRKFKKIGGFNRFVVAWDRSFVTRRNTSYLRTTIEWLNHYETLKKYEIDHKKSAGSYLWVVTIEDAKAYRIWLAMSDADRRKTGIMAKKTPGGTMVLPMGMKMEAISPNLPKISDTDTDILHMVTSGMNEPADVSTGESKGTYASIKATRGPMSDRISDEVAYFERFLLYDFYRAFFFLKSTVSDFPSTFKVTEVIDFQNQKPIERELDRKPEDLIQICFPVSEMIDAESRARAYLGVKHASTYDVLGVPNEEIAKKMGIGNYKKLRLQHATEEKKYPELLPPVDPESIQEQKLPDGQQKLKPIKKKEG